MINISRNLTKSTNHLYNPGKKGKERTGSVPRFLSRVRVNWLSAGGTLSLCLRTRRWRWMRTTLGHLTKRWRSFLGGNAPPIPNCFGLFSNSGFVTFSCTSKRHQLRSGEREREREQIAWVSGISDLPASSSSGPAPSRLSSEPANQQRII
jgi:hypothetical protein